MGWKSGLLCCNPLIGRCVNLRLKNDDRLHDATSSPAFVDSWMKFFFVFVSVVDVFFFAMSRQVEYQLLWNTKEDFVERETKKKTSANTTRMIATPNVHEIWSFISIIQALLAFRPLLRTQRFFFLLLCVNFFKGKNNNNSQKVCSMASPWNLFFFAFDIRWFIIFSFRFQLSNSILRMKKYLKINFQI